MSKTSEYSFPEDIKGIALDKESIEKAVDTAKERLSEIESEIDRLNDKRSSYIDAIKYLSGLYEIIVGRVLLDRYQILDLERQPQNLNSMAEFREQALKEAERLANHPTTEGKVKVDDIVITLRGYGQIPWKKPHNAIDTILNRSKEWKKIETGLWEKIFPSED